jgi:DNA-directed RNA polymerase subunit RPC12/RpoP
MKRKIRTTVYEYTCERCGKQWPQRPKPVFDEDGLKIKKYVQEDPKNCTRCKSSIWDEPKDKQ